MKILLACLLGLAFALPAWTQPRPPDEPPIVSPEVHPDRRVTFRLRAPHATEVTVNGDFFFGRGHMLQKGADGVWSVTLGPLDADLYDYSFSVDGLKAVDPQNPFVKNGSRGSSSYVIVPGEERIWDVRDVPHGAVRIEQYHSTTHGTARRYRVYTPPGYSEAGRRYPLLVLLHGSGDTEAEWTDYGRAHVIFDNLLADGKIDPMVVVMPYAHIGMPSERSFSGDDMEKVTSDVIENVLPDVERKYYVLADRNSRAVAGLSMGGFQTVHYAVKHWDRFAWYGVFSAGARQMRESLPELFENPAHYDEKWRLFWVACGREDFLFEASQELGRTLTDLGVAHEFHETEGGHAWQMWRRYLADFTPRLFKE